MTKIMHTVKSVIDYNPVPFYIRVPLNHSVPPQPCFCFKKPSFNISVLHILQHSRNVGATGPFLSPPDRCTHQMHVLSPLRYIACREWSVCLFASIGWITELMLQAAVQQAGFRMLLRQSSSKALERDSYCSLGFVFKKEIISCHSEKTVLIFWKME